jgi:class 3 adenylate cyclase
MGETRKIAAILVSDVVGYSRLAGADEDRILARLRTLRSDLIDPLISVHHGRIVKRTGDGAIVEFRSAVDAVRLAIEVQSAMVERNAEVSEDRRILFRLGIHLGDVVEESDGDLMGDGVNIAARLEGVCEPGAGSPGYLCVDPLYRDGLRLGGLVIRRTVRPPATTTACLGMAQDVGRRPDARHRVVAPQAIQQDLPGFVDLILNLLESCVHQQWMGAHESS